MIDTAHRKSDYLNQLIMFQLDLQIVPLYLQTVAILGTLLTSQGVPGLSVMWKDELLPLVSTCFNHPGLQDCPVSCRGQNVSFLEAQVSLLGQQSIS